MHDLREVADKVLNHPTESDTLAAAHLKLLIDYTSLQNPDHAGELDNWLTRYAVAYRNVGTSFRMDDLDRNRFREEIILATETFINQAYELTGTDESDLR